MRHFQLVAFAMIIATLLPSCVGEERPLIDTVPADVVAVGVGPTKMFVSMLEPDSLACKLDSLMTAVVDSTYSIAFLTTDGNMILTSRLHEPYKVEKHTRKRYGALSRYEDLTYYDSPGRGTVFFVRSQMWVSIGRSLAPEAMWRILKAAKKRPFTLNPHCMKSLKEGFSNDAVTIVGHPGKIFPWVSDSVYAFGHMRPLPGDRAEGKVEFFLPGQEPTAVLPGAMAIDSLVAAFPDKVKAAVALGNESIEWDGVKKFADAYLRGIDEKLFDAFSSLDSVKGTIAAARTSGGLWLSVECEKPEYMSLARRMADVLGKQGLKAIYRLNPGRLELVKDVSSVVEGPSYSGSVAVPDDVEFFMAYPEKGLEMDCRGNLLRFKMNTDFLHYDSKD